MDLFDIARSCLRRWYVVVPLLLVTAWYAQASYKAVKPVYYSQAVISLAPPSTRVDQSLPGAQVPRNGLLDVGGATLIANIAAYSLHNPATVERVVAAGGQPNYITRMFPVAPTQQQLPLVMIEATENNPADATKTVELVIAQADPTLKELQRQARVPDDQMVVAFVVSPPSFPAGATPSRTRSAISIVIAGTGLAVLIAVVVDVTLTKRKRRAQDSRPAAVETAAPPLPSAAQQNHLGQFEPASADEGVMDNR